MDSTIITDLKKLLLRARILMPDPGPGDSSPELQEIFNAICRMVFNEQAYQWLWDEPILSQLKWLFVAKPPKPTIYGQQVAEIGRRAQQAQRANDFFFRLLNRNFSVEEVYESLVAFYPAESSFLYRLKSSDRLRGIREANGLPSDKIAAFLGFLQEDVGLQLANQDPVKGCLEALKARESPGLVNALLVTSGGRGALVVRLRIRVQPGTGQVDDVVHDREDFKKAVARARHAMCDGGFLRGSDDVLCTLELTEPEYQGKSIGLPAAVGIYGAAKQIVIDPFTAFTGDINLDRDHWRVQGVSGLPQKLEAARLSGCRRVFIPRENLRDLGSIVRENLQVIPADDLLGVFLQLEAPLQPLPGDSLQIWKVNALQAFCRTHGWQLSLHRPIQNGVQFSVAPLHLSEFVISIYNSGTHEPKNHDRPEYQELLNALSAAEESRIPLRKVERQFNVRDLSLRVKIQEALERLQPAEQRQEPHCQYAFRFERGQEHLVVKQYQKGTLQIQGTAGELYKAVLECIIPRYNLHYPNAQHSIEALLATGERAQASTGFSPAVSRTAEEIPLPHIGTDESGKGDYFGPMVIAGVFLDAQTKPKLEALGVKDSKLLSDKQCHELAVQIRQICRERFEEVEIPPETYNKLYEDFRKEGKNLNLLLAWGHARAIESLLERLSCTHAVADQFGDEHYILSKLMEKGKKLKLVQLPKGERYLAVAAASILARDKFLARLEKLSQEYGIQLPKGSADIVVRAAKRIVERKGPEELRKVAKLHHKTTHKILGQG